MILAEYEGSYFLFHEVDERRQLDPRQLAEIRRPKGKNIFIIPKF